jgi:hypothetical protein
MSTLMPAPRIGDEVHIIGLISEKASQCNGLKGKVERFHNETQRHEAALEQDGSSAKRKTLAVKPENLQFLDCTRGSGSTLKLEVPMHLLIPCHVASDRRSVTFMRCVMSVAGQLDQEVTVFVSVSGPSDFRTLASGITRTIGSKSAPGMHWCLRDSVLDAVPQFERLRALLKTSESADASAWLMFLDDDDAFHPQRTKFSGTPFHSQVMQRMMNPSPSPASFC